MFKTYCLVLFLCNYLVNNIGELMKRYKEQLSTDIILNGKKHPEVIINENTYSDSDYAEIKLANETIKWIKNEIPNKRRNTLDDLERKTSITNPS